MAIDTTINAGAPPLLWSDVQAAFDKVNQNFVEVQATIAGSSITPVDFTNLRTNVSPAVDNNFNLGGPSNKWGGVFTSEYSTVPGNEYNGVWLGNAHIKGLGTSVELPLGSTVNGSLIIDPNRTAFKEIQVDNEFSIVATQFSDSFNLLSGGGINLLVSSSGDSIEINNSGIIDIVNGDGISVTTVSGSSTITNTGVRSVLSTTSLPTGRTEGAGININNSTGDDIKITNTGVISISGGSGIQINWNPATGEAGVVNLGAVVAFTQIQIGNDTADKITADSSSDTLIIDSGSGIILSKNTGTDTLTISLDPAFDLKGSIFGDDSTKIIDAVENKVYGVGGLFGNLIGNVLGDLTGNVSGNLTGDVIGNTTGYHTGDTKGSVFGDDSTMLVDGTNGQIVGPINSFDGANSITMDPTYGVVIGGTGGASVIGAAGAPVYIGAGPSGSTTGTINIGHGTNTIAFSGTTSGINYSHLSGLPSIPSIGSFTFTGTTLDSSDSSGIIITPLVTFNSDVVIENELFVNKISGHINTATLKSIVAASTSFSDFQSRIAALV